MDLKQIEYILKIAEENNITHAAEKLFMTQSALNQQLLKLEKELETPLFYRSRTDWRPTPAGEVYLEAAQKILMIKQDAYNQIYDMNQIQKGRISIGFTPSRGITMFTQIYPAFHAKHPNITVEPIELSVNEQQLRLLSGQLDIGFVTLTDNQKKNGLKYQPLASEELVLAVPTDLVTVLGYDSLLSPVQDSSVFPVCDLSRFREEPFVLMRKSSTVRALTDDIFKQAGFVPHLLFETTNNRAILSLIHARICCGILPMYYVDTADKNVTYFTFPEHPVWEIAAVYRKDHYITKAAKEFISLAADYFNHNRTNE